MTIREELRERRHNALEAEQERQIKNDEKVWKEVRRFIEKELIPDFRKMFNKHPTWTSFEIYYIFGSESSTMIHVNVEEPEPLVEGEYDMNIVMKAEEIAYEYDIFSGIEENDDFTIISFSLNLE